MVCYVHMYHIIHECSDTTACGRPPNECDINAACRPNAFGILECMCNQGFIGDGFNCQGTEGIIVSLCV